MSTSPDIGRARWRTTIPTILLIAAIVAVTAWVLVDQAAFVRAPLAVSESAATTPVFTGASPDRVFLKRQESAEAGKRNLLPPGTRSILSTGGKLKYGEWRWDDQGVPAGRISIRVDLARQLVSVFKGADEIGTAVIVYGANGKESPRGKLPILGKTRDYRSVTYDAEMPFSLWLRKDGVAVHGSSVTMGHATNGCIGVPVNFAGKLFEVASKGDIVEVLDGPEAG